MFKHVNKIALFKNYVLLTSRAESTLRTIINGKVVFYWMLVVSEGEMSRLITFVIGASQGY
jgi:hypothetical protein